MKKYTTALWFLVCFMMLQMFIPFGIEQVWNATTGNSDKTLEKLIIENSVPTIVVIILFFAMRWTPFTRAYMQSRPWGVFFWIVIAALGTIIPSAWLQEQLPALPNVLEQEFNDILTNRWGYLAVGILAPIGEEMVFRGAILRILLTANTQQPAPDSRQPSPIIPIAISAAIFALIHLIPAQMPHAFLVGMLLGWIYWRTGSILPTILFHWVNNSTAYVVYNLLPQSQDMKLIDLFGSERAVILSVVFSLFILLPAIYQLHLRMRRV